MKDFFRVEPTPGKSAKEKTLVRILYDSNNLYFAFVCLESNMGGLTATLTARDSHLGLDDAVAVLIDSDHDHRSCYVFEVNPLGTQADLYIAEEGEVIDFGWDGLWWAASIVGKNGWSVEMTIPFNTLRFKHGKEMTWGVNFYRAEKPLPEQSVWVFTGDNVAKVSEFGHLAGLKGIPKSSPLQLTPYAMARNEWTVSDSNLSGGLGLDLGFRPLTTVQANVTINPDYAEIEADPDEINLTREERHLEERRPFFSEGSHYFDTPYPLLYTRRVLEMRYGGKIIGRLGGFSFALLGAESPLLMVRAGNDSLEERSIRGSLSALRVERDVLSASALGVEVVNLEAEEPDRTLALDGSLGLPEDVRIRGQFGWNWSEDPEEGDWAAKVSISRIGYTASLWGELEDTGPDFQVEPGLIEETDRIGGCSGGMYNFWIHRYGFKNISVGSHVLNLDPIYSHYGDVTGLMVERSYEGWLGLLFQNQMWLGFGYQELDKWEEEDELLYNNEYQKLSFTTDPEKWTGLTLDYQQGTHYGSSLRYISGSLNLKPLWQFSLELSMEGSSEKGPGDSETRTLIGVAKSRVRLTRSLFGRIFFQTRYENGSPTLHTLRCLLGYEYQVRSALYLAYNYQPETQAHILMAKASYCWNL